MMLETVQENQMIIERDNRIMLEIISIILN